MTQEAMHSSAGVGAGTAVRAGPDEPYPPIAREGWPIIAVIALIGAAVVGVLWWLTGPIGGVIAVVLCGLVTLWAVWFFRDPARNTPEGLFIAPADGVVCFVGPATPPAELGLTGAFARISIFMNVFNVHVNRSPADATVTGVHYRPGKFFNASLDKASEHNERCAVGLKLADGTPAACVQIAGLIARRVICRATAGQSLRAGQRFGLIRFGSRVDVYLPAGIEPVVKVGQMTVAGETVIVPAKRGGAEA
jgi:phosphatidylserine decarboxylase